MGAPAIYGLMLSGGIMQAAGASQQGEAARKAARFNAAVTRRQSQIEVDRIREESRRQTSTNITRVAKSGVRLTGSPLSAIAESEAQAERRALFVQQSSQLSQELLNAQGRFARRQGRLGVASSVLATGGQLAAFRLNQRGIV